MAAWSLPRFAPRLRFCLLACLCTAACQGSLTTHPAKDAELDGTYDGVKFYPTSLVKEYSETTVVIRDGRVVASSSKDRQSDTALYCRPVKNARYIVAADFRHPLIMKFKPGLLESYTFNPTLTDGMLTGLNNVATPDAGKTFNNIATGIGAVVPKLPFASTQGSASAPGELACTDGAVVTDRTAELPRYTNPP